MTSKAASSICIIGGGPLALSAAYFLSRQCKGRASITLLEASSQTGGLVGAHKLANGEYIESYYHHIFQTDKSFINICHLMGVSNQIFFRSVATAHFYGGTLYNFRGPSDILLGNLLSLKNRIRFLAASLYLKIGVQRIFKNKSALEGSRIFYGEEVTQKIWGPLLERKFGHLYAEVPMSWLASRIRDRSIKLGYYSGGFHRFYQTLTRACQEKGVTINYNTKVTSLSVRSNKVEVNGITYDACLSTIGPVLEKQLIDTSSNPSIKYLGAICVIFEFDGELDIPYWTNYCDPDSPVLAVINHKKLDSDNRLKNCNPVYAAAYLNPDSDLFLVEDKDIENLFYKSIQSVANVRSTSSMPHLIRATVYRSKYAQPLINPDIGLYPVISSEGPLYSASMHSIYPNDRGQNYAFEKGRYMASRIARDFYK